MDKVPDLSHIIQYERMRGYGCEVHYIQPQWVRDNMGLLQAKIDDQKGKNPFEEIVKETKQKIKPVIIKKYEFMF